MVKISTKHRSGAPEIMDDFNLAGEELRVALDKIAIINRILGGNRVTLDALDQLMHRAGKKRLVIIDVGCGNGDMLRKISKRYDKSDYTLNLIGVDANAYTVEYARNLSKSYSNIEYLTVDVLSAEFDQVACDIALCTLTLHHFNDDEIKILLQKFWRQSKVGTIINDLHRSKLAYRLFDAISGVLRLNKMAKSDGLVSILRGFKKKELQLLSEQAGFKNFSIHWKWAFRYQWIIRKI